jgi:hypothetical protein
MQQHHQGNAAPMLHGRALLGGVAVTRCVGIQETQGSLIRRDPHHEQAKQYDS